MDTQIETILDRVQQALGQADLEGACEALGPVVSPGPCPKEAESLVAKVREAVSQQIKRSVEEGRFDQAGRLIEKVKLLVSPQPGQGQPGEATPETGEPGPQAVQETAEPRDQGLVLQIDGVGSFLIFTAAAVSVGPMVSPKRPNVGLLADPNLPTLKICRCDDDYFVSGPKPSQEGGATGRLLNDGDQIPLSERCYLKFNLPNRASATAVLTLVGVRLPRCDVQSILLADRDILIGPTKGHHIRAVLLERTLVLLVRQGRLWCSTQPGLALTDYASPIDLDRPMRVGPLSFVVTGWKPEV